MHTFVLRVARATRVWTIHVCVCSLTSLRTLFRTAPAAHCRLAAESGHCREGEAEVTRDARAEAIRMPSLAAVTACCDSISSFKLESRGSSTPTGAARSGAPPQGILPGLVPKHPARRPRQALCNPEVGMADQRGARRDGGWQAAGLDSEPGLVRLAACAGESSVVPDESRAASRSGSASSRAPPPSQLATSRHPPCAYLSRSASHGRGQRLGGLGL